MEAFPLFYFYTALLGITPAENNGTLGALYHLLKADVAAKLPQPPATRTPGGGDSSRGVEQSCPFPQDEQEFVDRSVCEECVCKGGLCGENNTDEVLLDSNRQSFNLTQSKSKGKGDSLQRTASL